MHLATMAPGPMRNWTVEPTKKHLMTSKIISRAACLAELISNPNSFFNCPDLHGGPPRSAGPRPIEKSKIGVNATATTDLLNGSMSDHVLSSEATS
jgi:hypothetical protein